MGNVHCLIILIAAHSFSFSLLKIIINLAKLVEQIIFGCRFFLEFLQLLLHLFLLLLSKQVSLRQQPCLSLILGVFSRLGHLLGFLLLQLAIKLRIFRPHDFSHGALIRVRGLSILTGEGIILIHFKQVFFSLFQEICVKHEGTTPFHVHGGQVREVGVWFRVNWRQFILGRLNLLLLFEKSKFLHLGPFSRHLLFLLPAQFHSSELGCWLLLEQFRPLILLALLALQSGFLLLPNLGGKLGLLDPLCFLFRGQYRLSNHLFFFIFHLLAELLLLLGLCQCLFEHCLFF